MAKKKILFLVNHEVVIYNFRKEIVEELLNQDYEVIISSPYGVKINKLIKQGAVFEPIYFNRHGMNPLKELQLINTYKKLISQYNLDVILSYTIKPNIYGGIISQLYNIPYIPNITGVGSALANGGFISWFTKKLYAFGLRNANNVFFQNKTNLNLFKENNIINEQYKILPGSGVNIEEFQPKFNNKMSKKISFLFIGRLMKEKGIQ